MIKMPYNEEGAFDIELELDKTFILAKADTEAICSVRLTEYGDMRSFISTTSKPDSFGTSIELVGDFPCLGAVSAGSDVFKYALSLGSFTDLNFPAMQGKGLLIKNLNSGDTIGYGIISDGYGLPKLEETPRDIIALC